MTAFRPVAVFMCMLTAGCSQSSTSAAPSEPPSPPPAAESSPQVVRWFGALHTIMHEGRTESAVRIGEVVPGPHAWGVGALEGLFGEATVLDDVVWLARPNPDGTATVSRANLGAPDQSQGAALLVVANVAAWDELPITEPVAWSALDAFLESRLRARGEALSAPVALRIEGPVGSLRWHVVDGSKLAPGAGHAEHARTAVAGTIDRADARLVGFFSRDHQGVFTHAGSNSHFHVVVGDGLASGHVDAVDLQPGARLFVPGSKRTQLPL
jgi:hypothetical protein